MNALKILFVEDVRSDAELIWHELEKNKITFTKNLVDKEDDYLQGLEKFNPDLIISDYCLPQFDAMTALLLRNEIAPFTPFIVVTGSVNEQIAVECMKAGADDYVLKGKLSRLVTSVHNSLDKTRWLREKKAAEEELRKSNIFLEKAQSIAHMGSWELDFSTKSIVASAEALKIYGFDMHINEIPLALVQERILPEYKDILVEAFDQLLYYNEPFETEYKIIRYNDGSVRSIFSKAELVLNPDNEKVNVIGIIQDITDRNQEEEKLKQSNTFNESLLKTIPFGMDIVDESGNLLFQSDNLKSMFGGETIGKKCWELYRDDKTQCIDCPLLSGIAIGKTQIYEASGVLGKRIFEISHTGMMYKGKKAILEIFRNITEQKENVAELIVAREKAEEGDKLKTAFLHNISHEIRTPMNAIIGFSLLLKETGADEQTRKLYIDIIIQSGNHLLAIISDIMDISNIEADLIRIAKYKINLNSRLKTLYDQFIPQTVENKLEFTYETYLADSDAFILTDDTKLFQILTNIINNAFKFTTKGHIKLGYKLIENFLEFSVSDTGIGIPKEHQKRVFDRFYKVHRKTSGEYEGTGLGLSISKAYVERMGGKIWLESEPDKGSTFYFTVPYEKIYSQVDSASDYDKSENPESVHKKASRSKIISKVTLRR